MTLENAKKLYEHLISIKRFEDAKDISKGRFEKKEIKEEPKKEKPKKSK